MVAIQEQSRWQIMPMKIDNMTAQGPSISVSRSTEEERVRDADADFGAADELALYEMCREDLFSHGKSHFEIPAFRI